MKAKFLAGVAAALLAGVGSAQANTVYIGWSSTAAGAPAVLSPSPCIVGCQVTNSTSPLEAGWIVNSITAGDFSPLNLGTVTTDIANTGSSTIYLYSSEVGLKYNAKSITYTVGLTENLLPPGWTVTELVYQSDTDKVFGKGILVASNTFTSIGSVPFTVAEPIIPNSLFSTTEEFIITPGSVGAANLSTISVMGVPSAIPEASAWAMMLIGFAGLGYAALRQSAKNRLAAGSI